MCGSTPSIGKKLIYFCLRGKILMFFLNGITVHRLVSLSIIFFIKKYMMYDSLKKKRRAFIFSVAAGVHRACIIYCQKN
jgi:hypothetical protein